MASTKGIIRKALVKVLESESATFDERIKAAMMLTKLLSLAKPGSSQSNGAKTNAQGAIDRILSGLTE
jgi:hypothetical protein